MGIVLVYQTSQPSSIWNSLAATTGIPYFSISVSLNVLLTLMIVTRLILHGRNIQSAMGGPVRVGGLYKTVVTMLIESCALYAVTSLLFIGPWYAKNHASDIFLPILAEVQVRPAFLLFTTFRVWHSNHGYVMDRSSLRSSSLFESLTGAHRRVPSAPPRPPVRLIFTGVMGGRRIVGGLSLMDIR